MTPTNRHLVVDGSNIATEGRTMPSLAQLDEAVQAVQAERPGWTVTVIVDATFAHRIDGSERPTFEDANNNGEITVPPAGAVGRGDAFILQVADKAGAAVLSNDSFQEFHGEHPWLFDDGRLIGGKPVEGIGWVFVPRIPVRGPASRKATRGTKSGAASSSRRGGRKSKASAGPPPVPSTPPPKGKAKADERRSTDRREGDRRSDRSRRAGERSKAKDDKPDKSSKKAKSQSTKDAPSKKSGSSKSSSRSSSSSKKGETGGSKKRSGKRQFEELNSPHDFMRFVTQHSIGDEVSAVVDRFSSHGCYLKASSAQCYLPSSAMGDPPPSRARDVVSDGQTIIVRVESLDSDRRGINVTLVRTVDGDGVKQATPAARRRGVDTTTSQLMSAAADGSAREANPTRSTTTVATKKSVKRARKRPAKKVTKKSTAKATTSSRVSKAAARRPAAKKTAAKKATKKAAKKTTKKAAKKVTKKAPAKKTETKKAAKKTAKKVTKKAPAKKAAKKTAKKAVKKTAKKTAKKSGARR